MYYPFLRGRQEELLATKALAIANKVDKIVPIIEPVNEPFKQLERTLEAFTKAKQEIIVILNPKNGYYQSNPTSVVNWYVTNHSKNPFIRPAILLDENTNDTVVSSIMIAISNSDAVMVHFGDITSPYLQGLVVSKSTSVFLLGKVSPSYISNVTCAKKIILQNTYTQQNNADYPHDEFFGNLHSTFQGLGYVGYGDFTTLENKYSTSGGQPYAVAIHVSYFTGTADSEMRVNHFKSKKSPTPGDAATKFSVALNNFFADVAANPGKFKNTLGFVQFQDCHTRQHFPGLGASKRYSIMHHVQNMQEYL